jgi:hypothetical protein
MSPNRVPAGRARSGLAMLAILAGGCFDPTFRDPICGPGEECPSGWTCANGVDQVCVQGAPPPGEPDAMPAACAEADRRWQPILANGNFEAGVEGWVTTPAGFNPIRMEGAGLPVTTDDGSWAALLGQDDGADQVMSQVVTIPEGTSRVRLSGQRCFATNEDDATMEFDHLYAQLGPSGTELPAPVEIIAWSNRDGAESCGWSRFDREIAVPSLPAATPFRLVSDLDVGNITTFYLDALVLEAFACPPALAPEPEPEIAR